MSKKYMGVIILICSFLLLPQNTYSSSIKEVYELQERCGKYSDERFKKEYGNGIVNTDDGQMISFYQNHYNRKLNKCFILITTTNYPKDKKTDVLLMKVIYDINENLPYCNFDKFKKSDYPWSCNVLDRTCKSEREWDSLVKPYMEE